MSRVFTQTFGVVGAILEKDGKIALVKENPKVVMPDAGKWNQPAGWIDIGENPVDAVKREVEEETGYTFEPTALLGVYSLVREDIAGQLGATPHAIKIIFLGEIKNHDAPATITDEIEEVRWFTPEEIFAMDSGTLRDEDIKNEIRDYLSGKKYPLDVIKHWVQKK
ncbi:MAG TPA: NUDIX domain-containing protein [Candidatus Gracilibacteria bacterium]|nr:NUDIX domain-containing protein [Candidatus Gracilibacteria bacterium]